MDYDCILVERDAPLATITMNQPDRRNALSTPMMTELTDAFKTLGADKGYDSADFVMALRDKAVIPHVAQHTSGRRSAIDEGTAGHPGYAISQRIRKRVEEAFGWAKTVAGLRKMRHRGLLKVDWQFTLAMAAYDLVRLPKLLTEAV